MNEELWAFHHTYSFALWYQTGKLQIDLQDQDSIW